MERRPAKTARARGRRPWILLLLVGGVATGLAVWWLRQPTDAGFGYDLRAVYKSSPFRNVWPSVAYVGDQACAECHGDIVKAYAGHPMGQSLAPVAHRGRIEKLDREARNPFERLGLEFAVLADGVEGGMIHRAARQVGDGPSAWMDVPVEYVVGSGVRGRSYLTSRDGYLFQTPISWFTQKDAWDLSPGFDAFYPPERVIEPTCLFCHANQVEPVEHSRNRYREPIFRGHSIGCERCHGPAELHVRRHRANQGVEEAFDDTIVNPRHLDPALQEAVCQQCHLQGERRIERSGRKTFDYRPGLPLHEFWAVFVRDPELSTTKKAVGQVEQMHASRCFVASKGKLGCVSCHDPHGVPAASNKTAFYRNRCLTCHFEENGKPGADGRVAGCALPSEDRRKEEQEDSCIACHMPRFKSSDIAHTAVTDHRVLRTPSADKGEQPPSSRPESLPVASFFAKECPAGEPRTDRDLGVALAYLANEPQLRQQLGGRALPLLEKATSFGPQDVVAWEARGWTLSLLGRPADALDVYERTLRLAPERELALSLAASLVTTMGRHDSALGYRRRLVAVNPFIWEYRYQLAKLLAEKKSWSDALAESQAALELSPTHKETRMLFISCCLQTGRHDQARREFERLVNLYPRDQKALRAWFAEHLAR